MTDKTFYLFSLLSAQKKNNVGIWDSLCFLVSKMVIDKDISQIDIEEICKSFNDYYDYPIPFFPMKELISRMISKKIILNDNNVLKPNFHKMKELIEANDIEPYDFNNLISGIQTYAKDKLEKIYTEQEIRAGLLAYLNNYQVEILNTYKNIKIPDIQEDKDILFCINHYIFFKLNEESNFKKDLLTLILANLYLNSIFYNRSDKLPENIKCEVFLDTRIIFRLLGCEGLYKQKEYESLISELKRRGYSLRIFSQHYKEVMENLTDCEKWINNDDFCYNSASPVLKFFHDNHKGLSDIKLYEAKVETLLNTHDIKTISIDSDLTENVIDEEDAKKLEFYGPRIKELIIEEYKTNNDYFDEYNKEQIITNDVVALLYIHQKRRNKTPEKLSKVSHLLLTNNAALVKANRKIIQEDNDFYRFTEALTDSCFGSYIWLTSFDSNPYCLQNRLISTAYDYIKINPKILKDFWERVDKQKETLTEEEYMFLREDELCYGLLAEKTLNHGDYISDKTPGEILTAYKNSVRDDVLPDRTRYYENENKIANVNKMIDKISRGMTIIFSIVISVLINIPQKYWIERISQPVIKNILRTLLIILGCYITYSGIGIKILAGDKLYSKINQKMKKLFLGNNE